MLSGLSLQDSGCSELTLTLHHACPLHQEARVCDYAFAHLLLLLPLFVEIWQHIKDEHDNRVGSSNGREEIASLLPILIKNLLVHVAARQGGRDCPRRIEETVVASTSISYNGIENVVFPFD